MRYFREADIGKPLPGREAEYEAAMKAIANAEGLAGDRRGPLYWFVDKSASTLVDAVALVDLKGLGNIAKGTNDWDVASELCVVIPLGSRHASRDLLETLANLYERGLPLGLQDAPTP